MYAFYLLSNFNTLLQFFPTKSTLNTTGSSNYNEQHNIMYNPSPKYNIRFYGSWKALTSGNCGGNITFKVY
jgi:hypothetical protein